MLTCTQFQNLNVLFYISTSLLNMIFQMLYLCCFYNLKYEGTPCMVGAYTNFVKFV